MSYFLCVMGMVMVVEGLPYFAFPQVKKQVLVKMLEMPDESLRRLGLVLMAAGVGVVYLGRQ